MATPTVLYRLYDHADELLYIGATGNLKQRRYWHRTMTPWGAEIARIETETFPTRAAALDAEKRAIAAEHPRYNVLHNGTHGPKHRPGIITAKQAADVLGITPPRVYQLVHVGSLERPEQGTGVTVESVVRYHATRRPAGRPRTSAD